MTKKLGVLPLIFNNYHKHTLTYNIGMWIVCVHCKENMLKVYSMKLR